MTITTIIFMNNKLEYFPMHCVQVTRFGTNFEEKQ